MIYLYPDLRTAIIGNFHSVRRTLIKGKEAHSMLSFLQNKKSESLLVLTLDQRQDNFINDSKEADWFSLSKTKGVVGFMIQVKNDFWDNDDNFIYFDAPNSKSIR